VQVWPPTTIAPVRTALVLFRFNVAETVPFAVPLVVARVIQSLFGVETLQAHPVGLVTVRLTAWLYPDAEMAGGVIEVLHWRGAAAWVTLTAWRATKTVVLLGDEEVLRATVIVAAPGPLPDAGLTLAHASSLSASHVQPLPAETFTLPVPPDAPIVTLEGDAE